jgi:hypothetical protein
MSQVLAVLVGLAVLSAGTAEARGARVRSYVTKKGTYVQSHQRTASDRSRSNNWSSKGNSNPYTGKRGSK